MICDVCHDPIILNRQSWMFEETREFAPGHTIVTYAAHADCHTPPAPPPDMDQAQMAYWAKLMGMRR